MAEEQKLENLNQNSILVKKDAKGNYNWEIKLYFNDNEKVTTDRIQAIDKDLKEKFGPKVE